MSKRKILRLLRQAKNTIVKYGPDILTAVGVVGLVGAGVTAVAATPKALDILKEEKELRRIDSEEIRKQEEELGLRHEHLLPPWTELSKKDIFKLTWKLYLPSVLMAIGGISCIVFARRVDAKRTAALVTAYKLSEEALSEFKERTKEEIGDRKIQKVEDAIMGDEIAKTPVKDIWQTGDGDSLYYDCYSHTYFRSDKTKIERALISFKNQIDNELYVDVNDWERALHLPPIDKDLASLGGWSERDKRGLELIFSYHEADNGEPCGYVKLSKKPDANYKNLYS